MKKVVIIEDEAIAAQRLSHLLGEVSPESTVEQVLQSVEGTVEWFSAHPFPDLVFMDIHLADGNAFRIFDKVSFPCPIIFTTAYDQYALQAFKVNSIDYLLKPIGEDALRRAVGRCRQRLQSAPAAGIDVEKLLAAVTGTAKKQYRERFVVYVGDRIIPVRTDEIAGFFSEEKANYLFTGSGERYLVESTLDALEGELDPERFFRISRGAIVARSAVRSVSRHFSGRLKLELDPAPPFEPTVSRARVDDFLKWLE